ncbi:MAG: site-specific recombinase, partial [Micromonosporaceae bacterium]
MTPTERYVAIYARLSPRPDGSYEGVPAQVKAGRAYAAQAWPGMAVKPFSDKGISAANGDHRPQYEALREAVARGEVAHLWA